MKKLKLALSDLKNPILAILLIILQSNLFAANITGPQSIAPGAPAVQYNYTGNQTITGWQCVDASGNAVPNVSITVSSSGPTAKVWVTKLITVCEFSIRVNSAVSGTTITSQDYYKVTTELFTRSDAFIYPGESLQDTVHDKCAGNVCHNFCTYEWKVGGSSASNNGFLNDGPGRGFTNVLTCPATSFPDYYAITCEQKCGGSCTQISYPDTVFVRLRNPTLSGSMGVSCVQPSNYVYTCTQPAGAGYYLWEVPATWTIAPGPNTYSITVTTDGTAGAVKVTAYKSIGSKVKSGKIVLNTVCCPANIPVTTNVNPGNINRVEADISITATNTIEPGGNAVYHAGTVILSTGFSAKPNCYFHAYSESCTGSFYRMASDSGDDEDGSGNSNQDQNALNIYEDPSDPPASDRSTELSLSVFPNPNNGSFTLLFNSRVTGGISISNELGLSVHDQKISDVAKLDLSLSGLKQGLYILQVRAEGKNTKPVKLIIQ
jgi:hypothetical protein